MDDNSPGMIAFREFEKERQKDFADSIDAVPVEISALRKAMGLMVNEDIRFIPVIACAFADDQLETMFKKFLPDNIPGRKRRMLEGSISSLFDRVQFAYAFDWFIPMSCRLWTTFAAIGTRSPTLGIKTLYPISLKRLCQTWGIWRTACYTSILRTGETAI